MRRPSPAFKGKESAVLIELYEEPNASYSTYTLTQKLNPTIPMSTPEYESAFNNTREAIEELVVQSLAQGKRLKGANGVYFDELKLTSKGEKAAIEEKRRVAGLEKALSDVEDEEKQELK
jgi:hypothetical protein